MATMVRIVATLTWGGIGFLLFLLWRIARFYEKSAGQRAYSFLFVPPLLLLPTGAACYIVADPSFLLNIVADVLMLVGGSFLIVGTSLLGEAMGEKR